MTILLAMLLELNSYMWLVGTILNSVILDQSFSTFSHSGPLLAEAVGLEGW